MLLLFFLQNNSSTIVFFTCKCLHIVTFFISLPELINLYLNYQVPKQGHTSLTIKLYKHVSRIVVYSFLFELARRCIVLKGLLESSKFVKIIYSIHTYRLK